MKRPESSSPIHFKLLYLAATASLNEPLLRSISVYVSSGKGERALAQNSSFQTRFTERYSLYSNQGLSKGLDHGS